MLGSKRNRILYFEHILLCDIVMKEHTQRWVLVKDLASAAVGHGVDPRFPRPSDGLLTRSEKENSELGANN